MKVKYYEISSALLTDILRGPIYIERPDGTLDKVYSHIPADAKPVRVWQDVRDVTIVGAPRLCLMVESEEFSDVPDGYHAEACRVTCHAETGYAISRTELPDSFATRADKIVESSLR